MPSRCFLLDEWIGGPLAIKQPRNRMEARTACMCKIMAHRAHNKHWAYTSVSHSLRISDTKPHDQWIQANFGWSDKRCIFCFALFTFISRCIAGNEATWYKKRRAILRSSTPARGLISLSTNFGLCLIASLTENGTAGVWIYYRSIILVSQNQPHSKHSGTLCARALVLVLVAACACICACACACVRVRVRVCEWASESEWTSELAVSSLSLSLSRCHFRSRSQPTTKHKRKGLGLAKKGSKVS